MSWRLDKGSLAVIAQTPILKYFINSIEFLEGAVEINTLTMSQNIMICIIGNNDTVFKNNIF